MSTQLVVGEEEQLASEAAELSAKLNEAHHAVHQNELLIQRLEDIVGSVLAPAPLVVDAETCTTTDFVMHSLRSGAMGELAVRSLLAQQNRPTRLSDADAFLRQQVADAARREEVSGPVCISPHLQVAQLQAQLVTENRLYDEEREQFLGVIDRINVEVARVERLVIEIQKGRSRLAPGTK